MQADRRQPHQGGQHGGDDQHQVGVALEGIQFVEPGLEHRREQESGQNLGTGLDHPELLEQLGPVAVQAFGDGFVTAVRPRIGLLGDRSRVGHWCTFR